MRKIEEIEEMIKNNGNLEAITVVSAFRNGYPEPEVGIGVIGFETFDEAEDFALSNGGDIVVFYQKNGWNVWESRGSVRREFDVVNEIDENEITFQTAEDAIEYLQEYFKEVALDIEDEEEEEEIKMKKEFLTKEIGLIDFSKSFITIDVTNDREPIVEYPKKSMVFYDEGNSEIWQIGVIFYH